jgi:hypothetical protein
LVPAIPAETTMFCMGTPIHEVIPNQNLKSDNRNCNSILIAVFSALVTIIRFTNGIHSLFTFKIARLKFFAAIGFIAPERS